MTPARYARKVGTAQLQREQNASRSALVDRLRMQRVLRLIRDELGAEVVAVVERET